MLATTSSILSSDRQRVSSDRQRVLGSIRHAEARDRPALSRLLEAVHASPQLVETTVPGAPDRGHLLVLDLEGAVRAAAYVSIEPRHGVLHGRLELLVIDPQLDPFTARTVDARMVGVAHALCEAYGCVDFDILATTEIASDLTTRRYGIRGRR